MNIVLIGLRGAGKSSVGAALAARLGRPFVDTDAVVSEAAGRTISEIFAAEGEAGFRRREHEAIAACTAAHQEAVIAVGGGAVLDEENRRRLSECGLVVWLTATIATLVARICADPATATTRPLLGSEDVMSEAARLLTVREPIYQTLANLVVATEGQDVAAVVDEIARQIATRPIHS